MAKNIIFRLIDPLKEIPSDWKVICERLAEIYNGRCYLGDSGEVNPYHSGYPGGGGHFKRTSEWFDENARTGLILLAMDGDTIVGYNLFYTSPDRFPAFADTVHKHARVPGIKQLGYTYLFVVIPEYLGQGIGTALVAKAREECAGRGCDALIHEFYTHPVPNAASLKWHIEAIQKWNGVFTGDRPVHLLEREIGNVEITYASVLIPTRDRDSFEINERGQIRLVVG